MVSGRDRPTVLRNGGRHTALITSHSVMMANVQCSNSIRSLKETPFSRRTNEDKLTTKQLGPIREILPPRIFLRIGTKESRG